MKYWIIVLFLLVLPSSYAWINCTPSACGSGYTDNGIFCEGGECYRNCTGLVCEGTWSLEYNEQVSFDGTEARSFRNSSSYNPDNLSLCYKFEFNADSEDLILNIDDLYLNPSGDNADNCDGEVIAGFWEGGKPPHPWYENLTDADDWGVNYWGDVSSDKFDYFFIAARSHTNTDSVDDGSYDNPMETDYSIYCAPTPEGCDNINDGEYGENCDNTCYENPTFLRIEQVYVKDYTSGADSWPTNNENLREKKLCPASNVDGNSFRYPSFRVYSMSSSSSNNDTICYRTNEPPSASEVEILPEGATTGDDIYCTFEYSDSEGFEEKNSSYVWFKDGVDQSINYFMLAKGNLSVGDVWSCEVAPSDGITNGSWEASDNVTILGTVKNPSLSINGETIWQQDGYYHGEEYADMGQQIMDALELCEPDADGFCDVKIDVFSSASGTINLSDLDIYYVETYIVPQEPEEPKKLIIKNAQAEHTAWFDYAGDFWVNGSLEVLSTHNPTANSEWIMKTEGEPVFILDQDTGDLYIDGQLYQNQQAISTTSGDDFIMRDAEGNIVLLVDPQGNMYITGVKK